jgi:tetratricopeptide (TPR) repeat protein
MRLKEKSISTRDRYNSSFHLYRGAKLSRNEIEQLHVGRLVATNGYLSTSLNLNIAQLFIGIDSMSTISSRHNRDDRQEFVLFDIDVDLIHSPEIILADVSEYSVSPDENEFIFDLGTTFIIIDKIYDINHYVWNIKMILSSQMIQLTKDYSIYIQKRLNDTSPTMMFGHLLIDISSEYDSAMTYFLNLLKTLPLNDEDRPTIYFYLARIHRLIGQYQNAIEYFRCALLLYKRRLPQSSIGYGRTLAGLATTYSEMDDSTRAICLYEKAIAIHRTILPPDHVEMAMQSNRLGYAYYQNKQYEHAFSHLTRTISFYQRKMPKNHPGQAQALHTMGLIQRALGNREKALTYYEQALHMRESLLSNDHPSVATTCYQISLLYAEQNDQHSTALDYAQRALNIRRIKLPQDHNELKQSIDLVQRLLKNNTEK